MSVLGYVPALLRFLIGLCVLGLIIVLCQDFIIFPELRRSMFQTKGVRKISTLPPGVVSEFIKTADGISLETWRLPGSSDPSVREMPFVGPFVGIVFHGNGGDVGDFMVFQNWFHSLGIVSYGFDYRGFGRSNGWPSEEGLELDADAVVKFVLAKENIQPQQLIMLGYSLGTAPAARAAQRFDAGVALLFAPYTDLRTMADRSLIYRPLTRFLDYRLPTSKFVSRLTGTDLIVAHGKNDTIIPFEFGERVFAEYTGTGEKLFLPAEASHEDVFYAVEDQLTDALVRMLTARSQPGKSAQTGTQ